MKEFNYIIAFITYTKYMYLKHIYEVDQEFFGNWIEKTYSIFVILNLIYLAGYDTINKKYNIKPNYETHIIEYTLWITGSFIPFQNIIQLSFGIQEDIKLINNRR